MSARDQREASPPGNVGVRFKITPPKSGNPSVEKVHKMVVVYKTLRVADRSKHEIILKGHNPTVKHPLEMSSQSDTTQHGERHLL